MFDHEEHPQVLAVRVTGGRCVTGSDFLSHGQFPAPTESGFYLAQAGVTFLKIPRVGLYNQGPKGLATGSSIDLEGRKEGRKTSLPIFPNTL